MKFSTEFAKASSGAGDGSEDGYGEDEHPTEDI